MKAGAQTSIQYWSNHGNPPTISVAQNGQGAYALVNVTSNPGFITDSDPDNFAQFLSVLSADCKATIRTSVLPNPGTFDVSASSGTPRYAGYFLGGDFTAVSALTNITLRTYDDGVLAESATSGTGINLIDLGSDNFFVYFTVTAPFDDVEIEFGSLVTALEDLEVYYAFATAGLGTFAPVSNAPLSLRDLTLSAHAAGDGTVHLAWEGAPRGSTVTVERSAGEAGPAMPIATLREGETSLTDAQPMRGTANRYRLRIGDADGSVYYSATVSAFVKAGGDVLAVYPNPVTDALHIRLVQAGEHRVTLRNVAGSAAFSRVYAGKEGAVLTLQRVELGLAPGVYFLELSTADGQLMHQRVVLR